MDSFSVLQEVFIVLIITKAKLLIQNSRLRHEILADSWYRQTGDKYGMRSDSGQ
jgi:hypothetical protein